MDRTTLSSFLNAALQKSAMTQIYTAHGDAQVGQWETIICYYDIIAEQTSQLGF